MSVPTELNFIDGRWHAGGSTARLAVVDPSHDRVIAEIPDSDEATVDDAVRAARRAFDDGPWPRLTAQERREVLLRLADELESRVPRFAVLIPQEAGCPTRLATLMQVQAPIAMVREIAGWAHLLEERTTSPIGSGPLVGQSEVVREPIGVCAGFVPFNFPLFMTLWKALPPLVMGNTVVLKSSPLTPLASVEFVRACEAAGVPAGALNLVHGDRTAGAALANHPGVDHITFTGSTAVGKEMLRSAATTVKGVTLELGGKSPSLVLPGADLELACRATLFAAFMHAGQACTATTRLIVPAADHDRVVDILRERTAALTVGPAEDPRSDVGPVISRAQLARIEGMVERAVAQGAKILAGGTRAEVDAGGFYFSPTVLVDVAPDMEIAREEVFGPVLVVLRYDTVDEGVAVANDSRYGLAAAVWGPMVEARAAARRLAAGTVWVNDYGVVGPFPFGGYKQSGFGREYGPEGMLEYTEIKHIYTSLDGGALAMRPYGLVGSAWR